MTFSILFPRFFYPFNDCDLKSKLRVNGKCIAGTHVTTRWKEGMSYDFKTLKTIVHLEIRHTMRSLALEEHKLQVYEKGAQKNIWTKEMVGVRYYITRNFVMYTDHLVLLVQWKLGVYNSWEWGSSGWDKKNTQNFGGEPFQNAANWKAEMERTDSELAVSNLRVKPREGVVTFLTQQIYLFQKRILNLNNIRILSHAHLKLQASKADTAS